MSHTRASKAQKSGRFNAEILPFHTFRIEPESASPVSVIITDDDGIRHDATLENFSAAKSAFPQWGDGKSTGPNSSQVTDGAAAVVLMRRSRAEQLGLDILGKHVATAVTGDLHRNSRNHDITDRSMQAWRLDIWVLLLLLPFRQYLRNHSNATY